MAEAELIDNATRELAAIMFSDIAGYTAIMGRDEQEAIRALDVHRGTLRAILPKFHGRLIGEIGDGTLSSFHSAIDAVNCAREVQALTEDNPQLRLRIGIHLGDVVFTNNTVIGDGVNVASRIHALAPPGGICVSAGIYDEVRNKPGIAARNLGQQRLKNVSRPIPVYLIGSAEAASWAESRLHRSTMIFNPAEPRRLGRLSLIAIAATLSVVAVGNLVMRWASLRSTSQRTAPAHPIRSIAVLPLDNFSGDSNQEYFADGMTDELTTDLASIGALTVISRSSVMQFKGEHRPPMPQIAKALNVDAVVEGSVLRTGDRVRITAQLIDAPNDKHLWAKSFERDSRDVLALQDELASATANEIKVELTPAEQAASEVPARSILKRTKPTWLGGSTWATRRGNASTRRLDSSSGRLRLTRASRFPTRASPTHTAGERTCG
jgi:TolB-like protein/class 3 adenylate cyclase